MFDFIPPPAFLSERLKKDLIRRWSSCSHEWREAYSTFSDNSQGTFCPKCGASKK